MESVMAIACELVEGGMLVAFSDRSTFLFPNLFMAESRESGGMLITRQDAATYVGDGTEDVRFVP